MLRGRIAGGADPAPGVLRRESLVHRLEDRRRRTEREVERHALEAQFGFPMAPLEEAPHLGEQLRRGALKGKDRLLLVADGENGPPASPGALSGEKLFTQSGKDAPLFGRGVLRLVDQQMIEPRVEFAQHPGSA